MSAEEVAKAFVGHFYGALSADAGQLAGLYNSGSMLTFEGQQFQGSEAIIGKLKQIGKVQPSVKTMDVQPGSTSNSICIFVSGIIQIGGENPLHYCEYFTLVSTQPGQYYIHNEIFRLNYGL